MKRLHGSPLKELIEAASNGHQQLSPIDRLRCLSFNEALEITGLSEATLHRLVVSGEGPPRVRLSERRWGYPLGGLSDWMAARTTSASWSSIAV